MAPSASPDAGTCLICTASLQGARRFAATDRLHGTPGTFEVAVCARCGAGTTLPRVDASSLGSYYPSEYGPYSDPSNRFLRLISALIRSWQAWSRLHSAPIGALRTRRPGHALDVGCGRGDLAAALIARGWQVTGVEPSAQAASRAARRGVNVLVGTVGEVPLEATAYAAAIFQHSLEHTPDPVADLRLVARALHPDGLLLVTVPNFANWQARLLRSRWYHLDVPRHRVHLTATSLRVLLARSGLRPLEVTTSTSSVGLAATLQYALVGRCLFPGGMRLRVASALAALGQPLAVALDALGGGGDQLHCVARLDGLGEDSAQM